MLPQLHRFIAKPVFVPGFTVSGDFDYEHGNSGEQQQMDPASLMNNEED